MPRLSLVCSSLVLAVAAPLAAQERIGTIERGDYVCELPGDAGGSVGLVQKHESFRIESASRYSSPQGDGTYLRRGDRVMFTSGPRNGDAYAIVRRGYLRKLESAEVSRLRCLRVSS